MKEDIEVKILDFLRNIDIPNNILNRFVELKTKEDKVRELKNIITSEIDLIRKIESWNELVSNFGKEIEEGKLKNRLNTYCVILKALRLMTIEWTGAINIPSIKTIPEPPRLNPYALIPYIC